MYSLRQIIKGIERRIVYFVAPKITSFSPILNTKIFYWYNFRKLLDINNPITLNEKILWLKFNTYFNNELVKICADKYRVREFVESKGLVEILPQLINIYENPDTIDWKKLPEKYALKLNVGCGNNLIVHSHKSLDLNKTNKILKSWLKSEYWKGHAELQYKDVKKYLLCEEYLGDSEGNLPVDYKFYCLNGKCQFIMYCENRNINNHNADYYYMDSEWNLVASTTKEKKINKPKMFDRAIRIAEILSKEFPFVRVDLYLFEDRIVFGELTFTPAAGMDLDFLMIPYGEKQDMDHKYGQMLKI